MAQIHMCSHYVNIKLEKILNYKKKKIIRNLISIKIYKNKIIIYFLLF